MEAGALLSRSCCPLEQLPGHRIGQQEMAGDGRQPLPLCWEPAEPSPAHHSCTISEPRWILSPPRTAGSPDILLELLQGLPSAELIFQTDPKHRSLCQGCQAGALLSWGLRVCDRRTRCKEPPGSSHSTHGDGLAQSDTEGWGNASQRNSGLCDPPQQPIPCRQAQGRAQAVAPGRAPCAELSLSAPRGCLHPQDPPARGSGASAPPGVVPPHLHHHRRASGHAQSMRMAWKSHGLAKAGR